MKTKTTLLLNWYANPYHTPIFAAYASGFYEQEGLKLAILEPMDPADVTEIIGLGNADLGLKAMIHTIAAKAKGFEVASIGTLLDEPPTGLLALKTSGIQTFHDIMGKKVGYIGEFGKKIIDHLALQAGIDIKSYESVRVGMNLTDALIHGRVDCGIGFINFQKVELETLKGPTVFLRIDQLAGLGCCCFCSIQLITAKVQREISSAFLRATQRGSALTTEDPDLAFELLCQVKPNLRTEMYRKIFLRTLPFFSRTLLNVERDWKKVTNFTKHLGIVSSDFAANSCYTNEFVPMVPHCDIEPIVCCL